MSRSPGLKVVESFMPRLSNRQFPLLRYGVFTPIAATATLRLRDLVSSASR